MVQIKKSTKVILYVSFLMLLGSFLIFSCAKEDTGNNNNTDTYHGIVDGKLVAINQDYGPGYFQITIKTAGINTTNGSEMWSSGNYFFNNIVSFNNIVYAVSPLNGKSSLYNINLNSGTFTDSTTYAGKAFLSSSFDGTNAYHSEGIVGTLQNIHAYNLLNTTPTWIKYTKGIFTANTVAFNNVVYYTSNDSICAANGSNGSVIWATKLNISQSGYEQTSLVYNNGKLYFAANATIPTFYCINAASGSIAWSRKIIGINYYQPIYSIENNNLVIGENGFHDGKSVYVVDKNTGADLWHYTATKNLSSCPVVKSNKVFFSVSDSNFYCLNASNGNLLWKYNTNNLVNGRSLGDLVQVAPIVADSAVFLTSGAMIHTLSINSGALIWQYNFGGTRLQRTTTALMALVLRDSIYYPGGFVTHK